MKKIIPFAMFLGFFWTTVDIVLADTLNVPLPYLTIQAAINAANAGDTVEVATGTYPENITMRNGVIIHGAGPSNSIIDGGAKGSVVTAIDVDSSAVLEGFKIRDGASVDGGGMYNESSSATVTNCIFDGNSATGYGGGMYNAYSSPTVTNCTFSNNTAVASGGGMRNASSSPTVSDSIFSGNSSGGYGGGMSNYVSSPQVSKCVFSSNSAATHGGGMGNYSNTFPTITNCTFFNNEATDGGGLSNAWYNSNPVVVNCTFYGNTATGSGGGISNQVPDLSPLLIINSILWGDSANEFNEIDDPDSSVTITYSNIEGGYGDPDDHNIDSNPLFVNAGAGDFHLRKYSPCIDAGNDSAVSIPVSDFEGDDRIMDGNSDGTARVDMGIDEYKYNPTGTFYTIKTKDGKAAVIYME